jgi:hypothetical protein
MGGSGRRSDLLNETVSLGAARVQLIALEDDLLKLTKGLEDLLEILLGDAEVDVADVETVEGSAIGTRGSTALGGTSSTVLLSFSQLGNDGDALEFLASQLQCLRNRLFSFELNVADARGYVSMRMQSGELSTYPLERPVTRSLTI